MEKTDVKEIALELIHVPEERSTSVIDKQIMDEIKSSIKERGILTPLICISVDGKLILVDGLHRLLIAKELGFLKVPVISREGTMTDVLIENMITARQHGKSDPVGEALVLKTLMEEQGISIKKAAERLHISDSWARQIIRLNEVSEQIRSMVRFGDLGVAHVTHLANVPDPEIQLMLAHQAIQWRYTAAMMKAAVTKHINPDYEPQEGEVLIEGSGQPTIIPFRCFICGTGEIEGMENVWLCPKDRQLLKEAKPLIMGEQEVFSPPTNLPQVQHQPREIYRPAEAQPFYQGPYDYPQAETPRNHRHKWFEVKANTLRCSICKEVRTYDQI